MLFRNIRLSPFSLFTLCPLLVTGKLSRPAVLKIELALELMLRYPKKIKAIEPDNADIRLLQQLVEQRRQLVEDKRSFVNRIINTLKQCYPQPLEWFSQRDSLLFCELFIRWPSLQQLKRARSDTVRQFMNAKGKRSKIMGVLAVAVCQICQTDIRGMDDQDG